MFGDVANALSICSYNGQTTGISAQPVCLLHPRICFALMSLTVYCISTTCEILAHTCIILFMFGRSKMRCNVMQQAAAIGRGMCGYRARQQTLTWKFAIDMLAL